MLPNAMTKLLNYDTFVNIYHPAEEVIGKVRSISGKCQHCLLYWMLLTTS